MSSQLLIRNMPPLEKVREARLPEVYEGAKTALSECSRIDQCQDWADKAEALASYARQAGDNEMRTMADRIQARAIKRCGQLLKEIESQQGGDRRSKGAQTPFGRSDAAREAGLSEHQQKTAIRVANIPDDEFDQAIESETPPTVTALAERGKQSRPRAIVELGSITPEQYSAATDLIGLMRRFREDSSTINLDLSIHGLKQRPLRAASQVEQRAAHQKMPSLPPRRPVSRARRPDAPQACGLGVSARLKAERGQKGRRRAVTWTVAPDLGREGGTRRQPPAASDRLRIVLGPFWASP